MSITDLKCIFPARLNYLCIEGVIGAGKTSLCYLLAQQCQARLILETADENPFLGKFYSDRNKYAFQTQLWFLVSRFKQLSGIVAQQDLFCPITLSDYVFAKDRIFASVNLEEEELNLYSNIAQAMETKLPVPDLVVYLQTSTEVLLKRIEQRGRTYEFNMDPRYITLLNEAYNHFFFHYSAGPLLIINTNDLDFVNNPDDLAEITAQIVQANAGTTCFTPMASRDRLLLAERKAAQHIISNTDSAAADENDEDR